MGCSVSVYELQNVSLPVDVADSLQTLLKLSTVYNTYKESYIS